MNNGNSSRDFVLDDIKSSLKSSVLLIWFNTLFCDRLTPLGVNVLQALLCSILSLMLYNEWVMAVPVLFSWYSAVGLAVSALLLRYPIFNKDERAEVELCPVVICLLIPSIISTLPISCAID